MGRQRVGGSVGGGLLGRGGGLLGGGFGNLGGGFGNLGGGFGLLGMGGGLMGGGFGTLGLSEKTRQFMRRALRDAVNYVQTFDQAAKDIGPIVGVEVRSRGTSDAALADIREQMADLRAAAAGPKVSGVSLKPAGTRLKKLKGVQQTVEAVDFTATEAAPRQKVVDQQLGKFQRLDSSGKPVVLVDGKEVTAAFTIGNTAVAPGQTVLASTIDGKTVMETPEQAKEREQRKKGSQDPGKKKRPPTPLTAPWTQLPMVFYVELGSTTRVGLVGRDVYADQALPTDLLPAPSTPAPGPGKPSPGPARFWMAGPFQYPEARSDATTDSVRDFEFYFYDSLVTDILLHIKRDGADAIVSVGRRYCGENFYFYQTETLDGSTRTYQVETYSRTRAPSTTTIRSFRVTRSSVAPMAPPADAVAILEAALPTLAFDDDVVMSIPGGTPYNSFKLLCFGEVSGQWLYDPLLPGYVNETTWTPFEYPPEPPTASGGGTVEIEGFQQVAGYAGPGQAWRML